MNRKRHGRIPFPHPGETIREDYLKPLAMSVNRLALELRVPATRMTEIVKRPPRHHCRHRVAPSAILQHDCQVLAEPSDLIRSCQKPLKAE